MPQQSPHLVVLLVVDGHDLAGDVRRQRAIVVRQVRQLRSERTRRSVKRTRGRTQRRG
jgi:hypothetical protein